MLVSDKRVAKASLHSPLPIYFRPDIIFFCALYAALLWCSIMFPEPPLEASLNTTSSLNESLPDTINEIVTESFLEPDPSELSVTTNATDTNVDIPEVEPYSMYSIALAILVIFHFVTFLVSNWVPSLGLFFRYRPRTLKEIEQASVIYIVPAPHCGSPALCPLQPYGGGKAKSFVFFHQKIKFVFDPEKQQFHKVTYPTNRTIESYLSSRGLDTDKLKESEDLYGKNVFDIPLPQFKELYLEHAMAPFFVFQVFSVSLLMLDEYWSYGAFTLAMLCLFEATVVKRRLSHLQYLRSMRLSPYKINAYRTGRWVQLSTNELLPGDLVSLARNTEDQVVPCDILLLSGHLVVNEALLTGESIPQQKEDIGNLDPTITLSVRKEHKRNIVFGGTKILLHHAQSLDGEEKSRLTIKRAPDGGCFGYVLRTGFGTSQGDLIRTILFSTEQVSVNNRQSLFFILFLLVFAIAASIYVLLKGLEDPVRSRYRLLLNCIMIITSVVPAELPMELSLAVNTSLMALFKQSIFCTEPFRIPFGGAVDVCCFDKTGTLTSDDFAVKGVAGIGGKESASKITPSDSLPDYVNWVIAGCHSLAFLGDSGLIGDPLEKASFKAIRYSYTKDEVAVSHDKKVRIRIIHRHPFQSALKRMTCAILMEHEDEPSIRIVCKGAPEVLAPLFASIPPDYHDIHTSWARKGCRVLALGYKHFGTHSSQERARLKSMTREQLEKDFTFAGFLISQCPIKEHSIQVCKDLVEASHDLVMITGDHVLTACHIANELQITSKPILMLTQSEKNDELYWQSLDEKQKFPWKDSPDHLHDLFKSWDFCVSGPVLESLIKTEVLPPVVGWLIILCHVFARVSPDQKEFILKWLKQAGLITLMCGDGTNDVGALKQSHIGVGLVTAPESRPDAKSTKTEPAPRPATLRQRPAPAARPKDFQTRMNELKAQLEEEEQGEAPRIKLGDASIASPFCSKVPNISCILHIVRQGRCTLVTTLQMYTILALNCLILAYSRSVLFLDGVKFGEKQMIVEGIATTMFFLFVSRSTPIQHLSAERPEQHLFTVHWFLSVLGQFGIHLWVLITATQWANPLTATDKETRDPYGQFKPNVLNTVVYLVSTAMTVTTFLANYRGRPFMQGLREHKPLFRVLLATWGLMFVCTLGVLPELEEWLELAPFPSPEFRLSLAALMIFDLLSTVIYASFLRSFFKEKIEKRSRWKHARLK